MIGAETRQWPCWALGKRLERIGSGVAGKGLFVVEGSASEGTLEVDGTSSERREG